MARSIIWYAGIVIASVILVSFFSAILNVGLHARFSELTKNDVYGMSETVLTIDATLFGLSALSGAIFLSVATRSRESEQVLRSRIVNFMTVSFLCFWYALFSAFVSLIDSTNVPSFIISVGSTITGSLTGSLYLIFFFKDYLYSQRCRGKTSKT